MKPTPLRLVPVMFLAACSGASRPTYSTSDLSPTMALGDAGYDVERRGDSGIATDAACLPSNPPTAIKTPIPQNLPGHDGLLRWIQPDACETGHWFSWLPFGSAWVVVQATDQTCEVWLGGETENPNYNGSPSQYCEFKRDACDVAVEVQGGGPPVILGNACFPRFTGTY